MNEGLGRKRERNLQWKKMFRDQILGRQARIGHEAVHESCSVRSITYIQAYSCYFLLNMLLVLVLWEHTQRNRLYTSAAFLIVLLFLILFFLWFNAHMHRSSLMSMCEKQFRTGMKKAAALRIETKKRRTKLFGHHLSIMSTSTNTETRLRLIIEQTIYALPQ